MSTSPVPPKADNTALYIVLGVCGGFQLLCIAPAIIIVVCLAAIQVLGQNASMTFQTVATSIGATAGHVNPQTAPRKSTQPESQNAAEAYLTLLIGRQYELAHALASSEFSERSSPQALRDHWERNLVLRDRKNLRFRLDPTSTDIADRHNYRVFWTDDDDREAIMDLVLVRDSVATETWRIRGWSVR